MIACCFSADKEKNLSFIAQPPLTDSVNTILIPLTDFEKTLSENLFEYINGAAEFALPFCGKEPQKPSHAVLDKKL